MFCCAFVVVVNCMLFVVVRLFCLSCVGLVGWCRGVCRCLLFLCVCCLVSLLLLFVVVDGCPCELSVVVDLCRVFSLHGIVVVVGIWLCCCGVSSLLFVVVACRVC